MKVLSVKERGEQAVLHDSRSIKIAHEMARIDVRYGDDTLDLKFGGDGDNGEHLMYLLDIYFEGLSSE